MNSILAHIENKRGDKLSEVRLAYNSSVRGTRAMLLVEGRDDEAFYEKFADDQQLYVYALNGCEWMESVLNNMNQPKKRKMAGIKDADFDVLNNLLPSANNLFLTDFHDHEMMCAEPKVCKQVAIHYGLNDSEASLLHEKILNNLISFSQIKWYCSIQRYVYAKLPEAPDNVAFGKCKVINHYGLDIEENLRKVNLRQSHFWTPLNIKDVKRFISRKGTPDLKMLVNGHDYCAVLGLELRKLTHSNIKDKEISLKLRENYSLEDFKNTKLAKSVENYFSPIVIWRSKSK